MTFKEILKIKAHQKLSGVVKISGAKNSVLPILAASLLCDEEIILKNVPNLSDVHVKLDLLSKIGSKANFDEKNNTLIIYPKNNIDPTKIDRINSQKIRTGSLLMGPLLSKYSLCPLFCDGGGCNLGVRALDLHIKFLKTLGAKEIFDKELNQSFLQSEKAFLQGNKNDIDFENRISVGATQNIIMASVLAEGQTIIRNAAKEPEIIDLCRFLRKMGAKISGDGTRQIEIEGIKKLSGCEFEIMPDRIETGSYILCALMNKAEIFLEKASDPKDLEFFLETLKETGAEFEFNNGILVKKRNKRPKAVSIETAPHPLFPTDLQQIYSVFMMISDGICQIKENLFENRFESSFEIAEKMSGNIIQISQNSIQIQGVKNLKINHNQNNPIRSFNLRGGMAAICSAFISEIEEDSISEVFIQDFEYVQRGYEDFIEKFQNIGGNILKMKNEI